MGECGGLKGAGTTAGLPGFAAPQLDSEVTHENIDRCRPSLAVLLGLAANSAFAADLTATQQATIKHEVIQMLHGMLAAEERLDADAVWACHADVPG